jgi:hypothetical protein
MTAQLHYCGKNTMQNRHNPLSPVPAVALTLQAVRHG